VVGKKPATVAKKPITVVGKKVVAKAPAKKGGGR